MKKISIVVPVAPWDFEPVQILLRSLELNFDHTSLQDVFVIFPDKDKMKNAVKSLGLSFYLTVLNEQDIIPKKDYALFKIRHGWFRQQIVKLLIANFVSTRYYLCLDSDILCYKKTAYEDLIPNGKLAVNIEPKDWHSRWWKDSRKVLKYNKMNTKNGMSSSTNVLIKNEVLGMIDYLEITYKKSITRILLNWFWTNSKLLKRIWTEYTLYWNYIEYNDKVHLYDLNTKTWGKSVWKKTELNESLFESIFSANNEGHFIIWQYPKVSIELIRQKIQKHLQIDI